MRFEIERKYLVDETGWQERVTTSRRLRDGLVARSERGKVRVRIDVDRAWLTVKSARKGLSRAEFEYEIPVEDAEAMIERLCLGCIIEKTRHFIPVAGLTWSVDEFHGSLSGILMGEVELDREDQAFSLPDWARREVTGDVRFSQANLLRLCDQGGTRITIRTSSTHRLLTGGDGAPSDAASVRGA